MLENIKPPLDLEQLTDEPTNSKAKMDTKKKKTATILQ